MKILPVLFNQLSSAIENNAVPVVISNSNKSNLVKIRLPPLPAINELVRLYKLRAIKHLSQNFLMDENLTNKIVRASGPIDDHHVIEVGPGPGSITRSIINKGAKKIYLIEKDKRFQSILNILSEHVPGRIETYYGDVLSFNMSKIIPENEKKEWIDSLPNIRVIGNLPFSVSTPLIIRWLKDISLKQNIWRYGRTSLTLTFQEEVAERLAAQPSDAQRCRLSLMAQTYCIVDYRFTIPGRAFVPKPDVNVGVVKFIPRKEPLIKQPFDLVEKVVRQTFHGRQKYCANSVGTLFPEQIRREMTEYILQKSHIDKTTRPFQLLQEDFERLCDAYAMICEKHPHIRNYNYRSKDPDELWEKENEKEKDVILSELYEAKQHYDESNVEFNEEDILLGIK